MVSRAGLRVRPGPPRARPLRDSPGAENYCQLVCGKSKKLSKNYSNPVRIGSFPLFVYVLPFEPATTAEGEPA